MGTAPAPPDRAAKAAGGADSCVPGLSAGCVFQPWPRVLARRYDGAGAARRDRGVAGPRVVSTVRTDLADRLVNGDLVQKFGQHRRIPDPAAGHFDGPDFQRVRIDAQMDLAPLARLRWSMFLGKPLTFSLGLDPPRRFARTGGAYRLDVDQKMQRTGAWTIRDGDAQTLLTAA